MGRKHMSMSSGEDGRDGGNHTSRQDPQTSALVLRAVHWAERAAFSEKLDQTADAAGTLRSGKPLEAAGKQRPELIHGHRSAF
ncbi:Bpi Fold-Containing Family B Member 4 [Manis pentadactyla]|nr:Bpi Fold-Containing Family B Member 4 [Manis pentadactyla]